MQCVDTECTQEGQPYEIGGVHLIMCQYHRYQLATKSKERARKVIAELDAIGAITHHTEGWTYVVRMANGMVKIGTTKKSDLERFQRLSRDKNGGVPVQMLAIVKGGESLEYLFHEKWFSLKIPGQMEEFHPDPALLRWAEELGTDDGVDIDGYEDWMAYRHNRKDAPVPEMFGDVVEQIAELQKSEAESFWE
ncbi:hypothetical protein GCM10022403_032940 [Streptomyces coacervatus]|uniref:GIY-YIG nuclease family protein n=1 Tax=Streptomyces coacervatus TaxID=647381 RepID=A0ABP7HN76_9ACTN|nr:hypothetical protein [Streptomyces coacervatus]MDF2272374.1 hypothetical protein [Streptomyces coacervatus]